MPKRPMQAPAEVLGLRSPERGGINGSPLGCPVGAIYAEEHVPNGSSQAKWNKDDPTKGNDHTFFIQHSRDVFAD
jgi:hypothetical protein